MLKDVKIPSQINGVEVRNIGNNAFALNKLAEITIGKNVVSIGYGAFPKGNFNNAMLKKLLIEQKKVLIGK